MLVSMKALLLHDLAPDGAAADALAGAGDEVVPCTHADEASAVAPSVSVPPAAWERAASSRERRLGRMARGSVRVQGDRIHVTLPAWASTSDIVRAHQVLSDAMPRATSIEVAVAPP